MARTPASLHRAVSALGQTYPLYPPPSYLREGYLLIQAPTLSPTNPHLALPHLRLLRPHPTALPLFHLDFLVIYTPRSQGGTSFRHGNWKASFVQGVQIVHHNNVLEKEKTVVPYTKPLKLALRHAPLKPLSLDVREDQDEKEGDRDEYNKDKRGTVIMDRVLSMGSTTPPDACTSESTCK
ncbi:hypothetical protein DL96DRAFT_1716986 [Flagelloscypha sp. PMI_526]|nr:hypothetical protein DL96DRAFT_1716986 [Flagelloscypha sp. PMI_526]